MTVEELRWKLRDYDSDFEVQTFDVGEGRFSEPDIEAIERPREDWPEKGQWIIRL